MARAATCACMLRACCRPCFHHPPAARLQVLGEYAADPELRAKPLSEVQNYIWHLRHQTFRRLAERNPARASDSGANGASGGGLGLGLGRSVGGMTPAPAPRPLSQFEHDAAAGTSSWPAYSPAAPSGVSGFPTASGHESRGLLTDHAYGSSSQPAVLPVSAAAGFEIHPSMHGQYTGTGQALYQLPMHGPQEVALTSGLTLPPSIGAVEPHQRRHSSGQGSGSLAAPVPVPAAPSGGGSGVLRQASTGAALANHL